ncbi:somatic embryogenesis receptor kinase 1-like [Pistacia vera]|uniref:somatic embryogenesis receptor kinase 1-like n=1 Tax=Pistacia vera TaxID=55513 RepID=UPI001262D403|nr:somatic embryogenesis receptor kinase 1-like [Pistacia vera]
MIKKRISVKKCNKKKQVLYKILKGNHGAEFPSLELVEVGKIRNHLVSVHVCSGSDSAWVENSAIKYHSEVCRDFSIMKKLTLKGSTISRGSLIKKVLKNLPKHCASTAVIVGTDQEHSLGSSIARCFANKLPATTAVFVLQLKGFRLNSRPEFYHKKENTSLRDAEEQVFENTESNQILTSENVSRYCSEEFHDQNFNLDHDYMEKFALTSTSLIQKEQPDLILGWPLLRRTWPPTNEILNAVGDGNISEVEWATSLCSRCTSVVHENDFSNLDGNKTKIDLNREMNNVLVEDGETEGNIPLGIKNVEDDSTDGSRRSRDETCSLVPGHIVEPSSSSVSLLVTHLSQSKLGWPLLRISAPVTLNSSKQSEDTTPASPQYQTSLVSSNSENSFEREIICSKNKGDENPLTTSMKLPNESELFSELVSSNCKEFSIAELKKATRQFSSDNLIGEGGCSNVYKGCLSSGKPVAVKVLKSYKEAWDDFSLEVDIISLLKHQNITPLIGVCTEDNNLMLVYDFLPKGSLEESLHGNNEKFVLAWEVRFKVAVAIAEALNYLHKECLHPVIHRDVKSSNILLSNDFQPQLSDFGLAVWGPTDSNYMIHNDVVGTFGYIAPEYFMHGRISDKVDVYSFGVVLLELLSGRRPIGSKNLKGQESLVKWAKPILESGDVEALMDPNLDDDFDIAQMQRLALVANLCINQSAQLRPKASQILELLRGQQDAKEWLNSQVDETQEDDELLLEFGGKPHLDFSYLVTDDAASLSSVDATLLGSTKQQRRFKFD